MQVRLAIISNAGGSGKTTLATHLAISLATSGHSVALLDLDPQGSLTLFCGQEIPEPNETIASVLRDDFSGKWPIVRCWGSHTDKIDLVQGGMPLTQTADELVLHKRGAYLLADCMQDYPLEHDLVIFDCPATLGPLPLMTLPAATHIIVPVQLEPKSIQGAAHLLEWYYHNCRQLRLKPSPEIMGFVPCQYDGKRASHRNLLSALPAQLESMNIKMFPAIRNSSEFINASGEGLPLHLYRKLHPAVKDFKPIAQQLVKLIKNGS